MMLSLTLTVVVAVFGLVSADQHDHMNHGAAANTNNNNRVPKVPPGWFLPSTTTQRPREYSPICCSPDIVIALDRSYISEAIYATLVRPVLINFFDSLNPCVDARVAFVEYASSIHIRSMLKDHVTPDNLRRYVSQYRIGTSSLGPKALIGDIFEGLPGQLFVESRGKRPSSPTYVFVFMGFDAPDIVEATAKAEILKQSNVVIMVFGVGSMYSPGFAKKIASKVSLYFPLQEQQPTTLVPVINSYICPKPTSVPQPQPSEPTAARKDELVDVEGKEEVIAHSRPESPDHAEVFHKHPTVKPVQPHHTEEPVEEEIERRIEEIVKEHVQPNVHHAEPRTEEPVDPNHGSPLEEIENRIEEFIEERVQSVLPPRVDPRIEGKPVFPHQPIDRVEPKPPVSPHQPIDRVEPKPPVSPHQPIDRFEPKPVDPHAHHQPPPPREHRLDTPPVMNRPNEKPHPSTPKPSTPKPSTTRPRTQHHSNQRIEPNKRLTPSEQCLASPQQYTRLPHPNGEDCHHFIACTFVNETYAIGKVDRCNQSEIYHKDGMSCVPEGPGQCSDFCRHNHIAANGCYGIKSNCALFFLCAHGNSYAKCCPTGTRFDSESCGCIEDDKCMDSCKLVEAEHEFTALYLNVTKDELICVDPYNNTLRAHRGRPDLFDVVENADTSMRRYYTVPCAQGALFDLATCRCEHLEDEGSAAPQPSKKHQTLLPGHQCKLYLPFNNDFNDHSQNKFSVYQNGGVSLNKDGDSPDGEGRSMFISNGYLEIPGLSALDLRNQASWCLFYRCQQQKNSFTCSKSGGLISNNRDSFGTHYSIVLASQFRDQITAKLKLMNPTSTVNINATVSSGFGWNHVCVVYDGAEVQLYANGVSIKIEEANGRLAVVSFPYLIGTDHRYGSFTGSVDEILMCSHAMTREEVEAHYDGNREYLVARGLIPPQ